MQRLQRRSQTRRPTGFRLFVRFGFSDVGWVRQRRQTYPLLTSRPHHHRGSQMTLPGLSRLNPCPCRQPTPAQPVCGDRGVEDDD